MYLKRIISENVGPIEKVDIKPSFNDDGSPKPLILVGENGSGKSTLLSNIVDSFYEIASKAFSNVVKPDRLGHVLYKTINPSEIKIGKRFLLSFLEYDIPNTQYVFKAGKLSMEELKEKIDVNSSISWNDTDGIKDVNTSEKDAENAFNRDIVCYFGPDRYEKPAWMGKSYFNNEDGCHLALKENWSGILKNPITIKNVTGDSLQWLLDIIADSRADIEFVDDTNINFIHQNVPELKLLLQSRKNVETILSKILGKDVFFLLNRRDQWNSRFRILSKNGVVSPTLDALSTGQLALFNMFSTIARYGDVGNINNSIHLENIKGIVVIDEVELHLHSNLQKEILPTLIKLFPKVQFIMTTHSPLFLLGMRDTFGEDGFDIFEMPSGNKIDVERFSEFQKAYDYYQHTQKHQEELNDIVKQIKNDSSEKPLIITEGASDWMHLEAAYKALKEKNECASIFEGMLIDFLRYEPIKQDDICGLMQSSNSSSLRMNMGADELKKICEGMAKVPQSRKYIFVADCDKDDVTSKLGGHPYKDWGNNVYSFVLPIPQLRENTPKICIEHLYSDEEIKTECEICGKKCRLFMGSEFDVRGISSSLGLICENKKACGPQSIAILEGSKGEKITPFADPSDNRGLSKIKFANNILNKIPPFDNFNFSNFIKIFEIIKEICNKDMV
jgi:hypothetical protein